MLRICVITRATFSAAVPSGALTHVGAAFSIYLYAYILVQSCYCSVAAAAAAKPLRAAVFLHSYCCVAAGDLFFNLAASRLGGSVLSESPPPPDGC